MLKSVKIFIIKFQDKIIEHLMRKEWILIRAKIYKVSAFIKNNSLWICMGSSFGAYLFIFLKYRELITEYLIKSNISNEGSPTGIFNSIFVTIAAAILGVLAIIFSLSLFAVQQAAERHTSIILRSVLRDKKSKLYFLCISLISLIFFVFALFPLNSIIFYEITFGFILLSLIFVLVRKHYTHIVNLINPNYQIMLYHNEGIKKLMGIDKELKFMIKTKIIKPPQNLNENQEKEYNEDSLKAGLIFRLPNLFDGVKKCIEQIYNLNNTYLYRKDYQVTQNGFNAIYSIVSKYIDVRNGTFFPSSIIPVYDLSHDYFLTYVFEKLSAIHKVTSKERDLEISTQIINCFSNIAFKCSSIRYRNNILNEFHHCMLAIYYMQKNIEYSLNAGLLDIGIRGADLLKNIGLVLIRKNAHTNVKTILDDLSKIAMYGIIKHDASFLISHPMKAYSVFLWEIMFNNNVYDNHLPKIILEEVQGVITNYIKYIKLEEPRDAIDMQYSIGDFVYLANPIAMPLMFDEAYKKIKDDKSMPDERKNIVNKILDFGENLWNFYDELSKCAAEKESFLIHYIDSNIRHISMIWLRLYQYNYLDDAQKNRLIDNISWLISNYWRIYKYHKIITRNYDIHIIENLLKLGYEFNKLKLLEQLEDVINIIISIANSFLQKQKGSIGYDPIRIVERAAYLCILNGTEDIISKFANKLKEKFWNEYTKKFSEHQELLINELLEIDPVKFRSNSLGLLSFENKLLSEFNKKDISKFVDNLRNYLK